MKHPIKFIFLLVGILFFTFTACQDEVIEETPPNEQEIIQSDSNLATLMRSTSANDGSVDNLLDDSDCFTVNLPVTIEANGITLTIETLNDLSLLEAIFDANTNDDDNVDFLFPITIILNDFTEINIESEEELENFIETCTVDDDIVECADFVYPISFSIYNTSFQVIDTVVIDNDYELYIFLEGLENGNNGVVLASLNFPVSIQYTNGSTVEVNNNQALEDAINLASENCNNNEPIGCLEANDIVMCDENNDGFEVFNLYEGLSDIDGCIIINPVSVSFHTSLVDAESNINPIPSATSFTNTSSPQTIYVRIEVFNTPSEFEILEIGLVLEDCSNNSLGCLEANDIVMCDENNDGIEVFNLYEGLSDINGCTINNPVSVSFHESLVDAESNTNPILSPTSFTNTSNPQTVYVRIEVLNNPSTYEILEIGLFLEDCTTGGNCIEQEIDAYLVECTWNVVAFNNDNDLIVFDLVFGANGYLTITGNGQTISIDNGWSTSNTSNGIVLTFSNIALGNIQAITGEWLILDCQENRLEFEGLNNNNTMVMERDCNNAGMCTPGDVEGMLLDCEWTVTSYAGSNFSMFNINFNANNEAVIFMPNGTEEYTANWTVSQVNNGVEVVISNVSGGNVQIINGTYTVVECTGEQLILHDVSNSNNELVLDRDCG